MRDQVEVLTGSAPDLMGTPPVAPPTLLFSLPCSAAVRLSDADREQGTYTQQELTVHCFPAPVQAGHQLRRAGLLYEVVEVVELTPTLQRIKAVRYRG